MTEWQQFRSRIFRLSDKINEFFNHDQQKIKAWWMTPNPLLGGSIPADMCLPNRIPKLEDFVFTSLEGIKMHTNVANEFLSTVPTHDYLHLLEGNTPKKVVDFLDLSRSDISKAMKMDKTHVRFDDQIPKDLKNRLYEIAYICELMAGYFSGDIEKTALWFKIKNPALGGISPRDMIRYGRYKKLELFIRNALAGIHP